MSLVPGVESHCLETVGIVSRREGEAVTPEILVVIAPAYQHFPGHSCPLHFHFNRVIFISWNIIMARDLSLSRREPTLLVCCVLNLNVAQKVTDIRSNNIQSLLLRQVIARGWAPPSSVIIFVSQLSPEYLKECYCFVFPQFCLILPH